MRIRLSMLALVALAGSAFADELRVGVAVADITPPTGYRRAGNYTELVSTGTNDPLLAKAIYFEQGREKFALVVCDQTGLARESSDEARKLAARLAELPEDRIVLTATHTHGGALFNDPILSTLFHERALARDGKDPHFFPDYPKEFAAKCAQAIADARKNARPARLSAMSTKVPGLAFNRRYHMKSGPVRMNPGKLNPDIVRAAGPTDQEFPILLVHDAATDRPFASLSAFAMHVAVYGGPKFGADFPGHLQEKLRGRFGKEFVSIFAAGTAGDTNHVNYLSKEMDPTPEQIGERLAEQFNAAVPELKPIVPKLSASRSTIQLPLHPDRPDDLALSKDRLIGDASRKADFLTQVDAYRILLVNHLRKNHGDALPTEINVARLGSETALVFLPHEVFVEFSLGIKADSPFKQTWVISLSRDVDFYVPTRKAFGEGSYEVVNSPLKPGAGEAMAEEAVRQLKLLAK